VGRNDDLSVGRDDDDDDVCGREGLSVTVWDKWVVRGNKDFTLQQFLDSCKVRAGGGLKH